MKAGYVDDLDVLITGELTNYSLMYTYMGSISCTVTLHGKEAHSSVPDQGYNAINHLGEFITRTNAEMNCPAETVENPVLGKTIHNVTLIDGKSQINSVLNHTQFRGNVRSIPGYPNDKIIALLRSIVSELNQETDYHLESMIDYNKIPVKADPDSPLTHCIQQQFDQPLSLVGVAATTDAVEFTRANHSFDFVVFGPGVATLLHQVDEYVEIDNYLGMTEKYQGIILSYLA